jgi:hypothetical protein
MARVISFAFSVALFYFGEFTEGARVLPEAMISIFIGGIALILLFIDYHTVKENIIKRETGMTTMELNMFKRLISQGGSISDYNPYQIIKQALE